MFPILIVEFDSNYSNAPLVTAQGPNANSHPQIVSKLGVFNFENSKIRKLMRPTLYLTTLWLFKILKILNAQGLNVNELIFEIPSSSSSHYRFRV